MKIGLISDTHIPSMGKEPPAQLRQLFANVDLIVHAGDVYIPECLEWLGEIAPVHAASNAFAGRGESQMRVSPPMVVEAGGISIGVVHKLEMVPLGDEVWPGSLNRYPAGSSIRDEVRDIFGQDVDVVVFGYTHLPMVETHEDILFVNPGSPNMVGDIRKTGNVAMLDTSTDGAPKATIIPLAEE